MIISLPAQSTSSSNSFGYSSPSEVPEKKPSLMQRLFYTKKQPTVVDILQEYERRTNHLREIEQARNNREAYPAPGKVDYYADEMFRSKVYVSLDSTTLTPSPIIPLTVHIIRNGMSYARDNGRGGFAVLFDCISCLEIDYVTGVLSHKGAFEKDDRVEVEYYVKMELAGESFEESLDDTFTCSCCGAPGQKGRCFYCRHIPGEKER